MAKKILLADDSLTIQKVVELTFSDSDFDLVCVSNGQKALEKVRGDRPDLILADVVMPEKNGYEVCEEIKGNPSTCRIPVVLLSGTFEPFDRERAERIGCDAIVSKPFDSQQLIAQVEVLLARAPAEASAESAQAPAASEASLSESASGEEERAPFETGFAADDFTGSLQPSAPDERTDPFEEEYVRGDVDSAILAFERSHPEFASGSPAAEERSPEREPSSEAPWLAEEPDSAPGSAEPGFFSGGLSAWGKVEREFPSDSEKTGPIALSEVGPLRAAAPTEEIPQDTAPAERPFSPEPRSEEEEERPAGAPSWMSANFGRPPREVSEYDAEILFDVPSSQEERVRDEGTPEELSAEEALPPIEMSVGEDGSEPEEPAAPAGESASSSGELEVLAHTASIPELNTMLSSLTRSGGELSDEEIDRLAKRIVEKLSDRVLREIAWEIIPDMAEIVIKQRIKELEADIE